MDLESILEPLSNQVFKIIRGERSDDIDFLKNWCDSIKERLDMGKFVNLALDCEGFNLGLEDHSLICVQLGEIYNDTFDIFSDEENTFCPEVDPHPGVIVSAPFTANIKTMLNQVLNHPKITLITFDFTGDIGTLLEEGLLITLKRVIDCQLQTFRQKRGKILEDTKN
jgi:hypothetical protein